MLSNRNQPLIFYFKSCWKRFHRLQSNSWASLALKECFSECKPQRLTYTLYLRTPSAKYWAIPKPFLIMEIHQRFLIPLLYTERPSTTQNRNWSDGFQQSVKFIVVESHPSSRERKEREVLIKKSQNTAVPLLPSISKERSNIIYKETGEAEEVEKLIYHVSFWLHRPGV